MIRLSIQCAAIAFLVPFCAAPLHRIAPSRVTEWILANGRYFFLTLSVAFGWHLFFSTYRSRGLPMYSHGIFSLGPVPV
jgi:hypothetical protein